MKRCPQCRRDYYDETLLYCLDDGNPLLDGPASGSEPSSSAGGQFGDEPQTAILSEPGAIATGFPSEPSSSASNEFGETATRAQVFTTDQTAILPNIHPHKASTKNTLIAGAIGIVLISVLGIGSYWLYGRGASSQISSIAVMPFENRNSDADTDYLSDGLAESVIFRLTQIPDLKVSPTSSVMRYKGKETDVAKIASELAVDAVMTGRLTKRGDNLNITVELVDARTNKSLWGEQYERKLSELLTTQRDIVAEIVGKLQLKLSGESEQKLAKKYTDNNEAYQLYLQGRYHWNKRTGESLKQAVEFFSRAIEKDPKFALAHSGLAESYTLFSNYSVAPPLEAMPKAKAAALRAIEIDDSLAETHVALGIYYSLFAWNQLAAEKEFRRAIELNPNYATAHQQFASECLTSTGRFDEAVAEAKRAEELDPLSPIIGADLGNVLIRARRFDEAIGQLNRTLTLDPNFWVAYWYLGMAYHGKGEYSEAVAAYRKGRSLNDNPFLKALHIRSLAKTGERTEAVKLLDELQAESERRYVSSSTFAVAYGALGEKDKAFAALQKDIAERGSRLSVLSFNPIWDDLREEPRFAELVRRVEASKME